MVERESTLPRLSGTNTFSQGVIEFDARRRKLVNLPNRRKATVLTFILRQDLHHVILELRRVTVLTSISEQYQESINQGPRDYQLALSSRIDQQHQDLSDRLDALGKLIFNGKLQDSSRGDQISIPSEKETNTHSLRILTSHRIPCRSWCPCTCHAKRKLMLTAPGLIENVLGRMFVGYSGFPVVNKPCDFRGCRDQQKATATIEYWFPWWFVSMNSKLCLTYLPLTGPQCHLSTTRRIPDDSQSIAFAMQGNIDGLKYLFSQGLVGPRDVSDSRGFTLMRVRLTSTSARTLLILLLVGALRRYAQSQNSPILD